MGSRKRCARSGCDRQDRRLAGKPGDGGEGAAPDRSHGQRRIALEKHLRAGIKGALAEGEGFEPPVPVIPGQRFSRSQHDGLHDRRPPSQAMGPRPVHPISSATGFRTPAIPGSSRPRPARRICPRRPQALHPAPFSQWLTVAVARASAGCGLRCPLSEIEVDERSSGSSNSVGRLTAPREAPLRFVAPVLGEIRARSNWRRLGRALAALGRRAKCLAPRGR